MPNRILKDSILASEQINDLSWFEEVVFYRLIVSADDYGCMDGRSAYLKSILFPLKDKVTKRNIEQAIAKLASVGLLVPYVDRVSGNVYLFLPTWCKHQRLRSSKHKYPMPEFDDSGNMISERAEFAASCRKLPQVAASCGSRRRALAAAESESESESEIESEVETPPIIPPTGETVALTFDAFWAAYPKKKAKEDAKRAFAKINDADKLNIISALNKQKASYDWTKDGGRFVPYPATWLNGRRWEDETVSIAPKSHAAQEEESIFQMMAEWAEEG